MATDVRGVVLGLGHPDRGDDAIGLVGAEALAPDPPLGWRVHVSTSGLLGALHLVEGAAALIVLDAVVSGHAPPGTLHRFELSAGSAPSHVATVSSHGLDLVDEMTVAQRLGLTPESVIVLGIEVDSVMIGTGLSVPVLASVDDLVAAARHEAAAAAVNR